MKNVDNMTENAIIAVGQATLSGSGSGGAVGCHSDPSGVRFAFTSRFVALSKRIRNSVAQLSRIVTNLPKIRRNHVVTQRIARTPESIKASCCGAVFSFSSVVNSESIRPAFPGVLPVNNLEEINHTLSSEGENE